MPTTLLSVFYYSYGPGAPRTLGRAQGEMLTFAEECGSIEWEAIFGVGRLQAAVVFRDTANRWWTWKFDGSLMSVTDESDGIRIVGQDYREHWLRAEARGQLQNLDE